MAPALPLHCGLGECRNTFPMAYAVTGSINPINPSTHPSSSLKARRFTELLAVKNLLSPPRRNVFPCV
jgi:hypothetical protein